MCAKRRLPVFHAETAAIPARQAPAQSEDLGEGADRSAESLAEGLSVDRGNGFSPRPAPEPPAHDEARQGRRDARSAGLRSDGTGRLPHAGASLQHSPGGSESKVAKRAAADKVRVGFLVHALELGGTERWLISLLEHCDRSRIEWTGVGLVNESRVDPSIVAEVQRYVPVFRGPVAARQVVAGSDALICHFIPNLSSFTAGFSGRTILVSHLTGDWNQRLIASAALGAKEFVAVSKAAAASFPPGRPVTVLHNGVDEKRVVPQRSREDVRREWGLQPQHIAVGFVGRFAPEKRPELVAQAVAQFGGDYRAVFVGGGPSRGEAVKSILSALPSAIVRPPVAQVGDVLGALDCFVLPSRIEGFSLGLAEAWLAGVPTVATPAGALNELEQQHGQLTVRLADSPTAGEVAAAIGEALAPDNALNVERARGVVKTRHTSTVMAHDWTRYLAELECVPKRRIAPPESLIELPPLVGRENTSMIADIPSTPRNLEDSEEAGLDEQQAATEQVLSDVPILGDPSSVRDRPRVSIIVTARNYGRFLSECLASCLDQTEPFIEVIYCDDASTDESLAVARSFDGVRIVACHEHLGVVAARNRGAAESKGEVLIFLDGDDVLTPSFVAAKLDALTPRHSFAYGHVQDFGERNGLLRAEDYAGYQELLKNNFCESASAIWRCVFEAAGRYQRVPDNTLDDWHLWLRAARIAPPVKSESVLLYRVHSHSKSRTTGFARAGANQAIILQRLRAEFEPGGMQYQRPVRVGFVFPHLHLGGAQQWLMSLLRRLPACGYFEFSGVVLTRTDLQSDVWINRAAQYASLYAAGVNNPKVVNLSAVRDAVQFVAMQSDVLVCWCNEPLDEMLENFTGPVVLVSHGTSEWAERMMAVNKDRATHLAACSQAAAGAFGGAVPVKVLHNGVEPDLCRTDVEREDTRRRWGLSKGEIAVGHVGRLMWDKNPLALAYAVATLGAPYRAVFVGSGIRQWDVQEAIRHALADPIFLGETSHVGDVLAALDCFVLATPHEGFSLSLVEAWMAGVPVVATRVGAIPELEAVHGALVVPVPVRPTPGQLAAAVREAIDSRNRKRIDRAKRVAMEHFTAAAMSDRWANYLLEIVKCGNPNGKPVE